MNPINTILLQPTDVLFFRDGRPMEGSLAGHGAAWPLPSVTDAAFHAALHRSGLNGHPHDHRCHAEREGKDNRQYGSLVTAGPFPVLHSSSRDTWFFPRPLDLQQDTLTPSLLPTRRVDSAQSSLPKPLQYPVASTQPPSKDSTAKAWLLADAYERYLYGGTATVPGAETLDDSAFSDQEATVGIAIDVGFGRQPGVPEGTAIDLGKGPALALLLAGPALSLPNMLVIRSIMGTRKTVVFVSLVVVMATITGMIYGAFF